MHQRSLRTRLHLPSYYRPIFLPPIRVFHRSLSTNTKSYNPHSSLDIAFFEEQVQSNNRTSISSSLSVLSSTNTIRIMMSTETTAPVIIDGKATADAIRLNLKEQVAGMTAKYGRVSILCWFCLTINSGLKNKKPKLFRV